MASLSPQRFQPASYTVERSATIDAPPEVVFAHVNDFTKWQQFNAWGDADPNAVYTYSDVSSGVGANFHWKGNSEMGEGRMTILESKPNEYVKVDLEFIEPFAGKAVTEYVIAPEGTNSKLTQLACPVSTTSSVGSCVCSWMWTR